MITLIQFPMPKQAFTYSPFCLKMETFLKIAKVPYENKLTISTSGSKKKKLPMILDNGTLVEDSTFIIEHLKKNHRVDLDAHLSEEQKAIGKAFQWMCEKMIVDTVVYFRWVEPKNWPRFREKLFSKAPWLVKVTFANSMARRQKKTLYQHGIGRFDDAEKLKLLNDNLQAISTYLGKKRFFFGDRISSFDAILFAHLVQLNPRGVIPQFTGLLDAYPNLKTYLQNIQLEYWPEIIQELN